jgi:hypothetical protein
MSAKRKRRKYRSFMDDPKKRGKFEREYKRLSKELEPFQQALRDSERITEEDLRIIVY